MIKLNHPAPMPENLMSYQNGEFKTLNLADYKGSWLVLFFYPRDFTFICPTEIRSFGKQESEFAALGAKIVGASTDSEWSHKAWFERDLAEVKYPIIADTTHELSRAYDVLNEKDGSADRGLFIINPAGDVAYALLSSGSVGRSVTETLRVLKALQSGELCPVEWHPGEQTLGKA